MAHPGIEVLSPAEASRVAQEVSEHVGTAVEAPQVHAMAQVAQTRDPDVLRFVAKFLGTVEAEEGRRKELVAGWGITKQHRLRD